MVGFGTHAQSQGFSFGADSFDQASYHRCLQLAESNPDQAFEQALSWQDIGGGPAAQHCAALALFFKGHLAEAAERLDQLAHTMPADSSTGLIAAILGQGAVAWREAGELAKADALHSQALALAPNDSELWIDRALTAAAASDYQKALADLDQALTLAPHNAEALVYRASAHRYLEQYAEALADAERAHQLDPQNPEALLEHGIASRLAGDHARARADWLAVVRNHDGRPAADLARRNLELLDLGQLPDDPSPIAPAPKAPANGPAATTPQQAAPQQAPTTNR